MAARFPQSGLSVAYKIKAAWASKIHAIWWAVGADTVQMLRSGDTLTTVISRAASGAGFDAASGRITGTSSGYFTYEQSGGFGLQERDNFSFGASFYGDLFAGGIEKNPIGSATPPDEGWAGFKIQCSGDGLYVRTAGGSGPGAVSGYADDVAGWMSTSVRHDKSDGTAAIRVWKSVDDSSSAAEVIAARQSSSVSSTSVIAATGRPLYFGGSEAGSGNTSVQFEACWLCGVLTDAEMATITSDPASIIEVATPTITLTPDPASVQVGSTRTFTATRSAPAGAGGVTYNVSSDNPAVATVPTPQSLTESDSDLTFDATGVSVGTANITITNAADSSETDTVALTVNALTKKLKLLAHADAQGDSGVAGVVFDAPTGSNITGPNKIGEFTGKTFEASLEGGKAVLKVPVADFGGSALTTSDTPVALVRNATNTTGIISCTVIEE